MLSKRCSRCKQLKSINGFSKDKYTKDGLDYHCKICKKIMHDDWISKNKSYYKEYRKNNAELIKRTIKKWQEANHDKIREVKNKWQKNNPDKVALIQKRYKEKNKDRIRKRYKVFCKNHPEIIKKSRKKTWEKRMRNNTNRLNHTMKSAIGRSLKSNKNGLSWLNLVNYSIKDLIKHLEKQFKDKMSWNNYGYYGWHIDHIIPVSWWQFNSPEDREFKQCWALCNLQPLWRKDNQIKSDKMEMMQ